MPAPTTFTASPDADRTEPAVDLTERIRDALPGVSSLAAANVIMQLARLPVGHGVARSRVDSGRVDRHPIKRLRTTTTYLIVALLGDEHERDAMRREVDRAHRDVHDLPGDPVPYNAFDRDLQLWVAACLYVGFEQYMNEFRGPVSEAEARAFYRYAARLGTTLQVREEDWPADRAAFAEYWADGLTRIRMDDTTRAYLQDLAAMRFLPAPVPQLLGPLHQLITLGFLPPPFRAELGLPWGPRHQRAFDRVQRLIIAVDRLTPRAIRHLPTRLYARDVRRRIRTGRPIV